MTTGAGGGDGGGAAGGGAPGAPGASGAPGTGGNGASAPSAPATNMNVDHVPEPFYEMLSGEDVIEDRKLTPLKAFQQRNRERLKAAAGKVYERASMFVQRVVPTSQRVDWRQETPFAKRVSTLQQHRDAAYHSGDESEFARRGELLDKAESRAKNWSQSRAGLAVGGATMHDDTIQKQHKNENGMEMI